MDMLLDNDPLSPTYGDLVYDNSSATVTSSQADGVAQKLTIKLRTFLGEWFLDTDAGIPYYQQIFGKVRSKAAIDSIFIEKISEEPDVAEIIEFTSTINSGRTYEIRFKVRTNLGQITDSITVSVGA